jgi:cytochrome c-type biogenesis protein
LHIGDEVFEPEHSIGPNVAEHHRITVYSIPKRTSNGDVIDLSLHDSIRLYVSNYYLDSEEKLTFIGRWNAPFDLPEELKSRSDITPVAVLALGAGLLSSVLTPCLLQLVVIFGSIISSFATVPGEAGGGVSQLTPHIRRKVMQIAVAFVIGFTLLYTMAGALIGYVGHTAQLLFAEHSRNVAVGSGIIVILMGIWIGVRGGRDLACRIPDRSAMRATNLRDAAGSLVVSMGYALGCTACFGGAIVATLIIYVGAIGSAAIGAGIMLTFSIGVAIPFLLAAFYMSRMDSVLVFFASKARTISLVSMVLIISFGLILITDNFHVVSDAIYPYLGLN